MLTLLLCRCQKVMPTGPAERGHAMAEAAPTESFCKLNVLRCWKCGTAGLILWQLAGFAVVDTHRPKLAPAGCTAHPKPWLNLRLPIPAATNPQHIAVAMRNKSYTNPILSLGRGSAAGVQH